MVIQRQRAVVALFLLQLLAVAAHRAPMVNAQCNPGGGLGGVGADIVVGDLVDVSTQGIAGGYRAYSLETVLCNIGTAAIGWVANSSQHPIWTLNLYRLESNRYEQIAHSWVRHGFFPLQQNTCGCGCIPSAGVSLGVGCSTVNSAGTNGHQESFAARSDVIDAHLAIHPGLAVLAPPIVDVTSRRLRVLEADLDPTLHPGARYFLELMVLAPDDAAAGNNANNASYIELQVLPGGSLGTLGTTQRQRLGIEAWASADPAVQQVEIADPDGARLVLAASVRDNANGTWTYEYAVQNLDSTDGLERFALPIVGGAQVIGTDFHGLEQHSGEIYDDVPWVATITPGSEVAWEIAPGSTNALRWGSLFNFSVTANAPPGPITATLGWFAPGFPNDGQVLTMGPVGGGVTFVRGDCGGEGSTNIADAVLLLGALFPPPGLPSVLSCPSACDANDDGALNIADVVALLGSLFGSPTVPLSPPLACGVDPNQDGLSCTSFPACP
ncbi:MAG: hypothetical protein AB7O52_03875 [Planctomycetota bacterium]